METLKKTILYIFILLSFQAYSQTTITIGSGSSTNTNTGYPAPYGNWYFGAKHQMLILASELGAQGMTAGDISSLAFKVATIEGTPLTDFTIKIKNTSSLTTLTTFETGLTTVYGPQTYTESNGWNAHTFSSPFYWDGTSNLLIETCFNNTNFTLNAVMFMSSTSFESTSVLFQDASGVCSSGNAFNTFTDRPNMRLEWQTPNAPPVCDFSVSSINTCSGDIQFFDQSTNSPTSWSWNFGDGGTSTLENPTHTYLANGTYTVSLTTTNAFGSDSETKANYIIVNVSGATPIAATCIPNTTDGSLGFGITNVIFNTLNINTGNAIEGYTDLTCSQTTVFAGQSYNISITHASPTTHNCAAWIDYNNDGVFNSTSELIVSSSSSLGTSGSVTIPSNATLNTPLRMRVIADYDLNPDPTPCDDPGYGQAEDYTIIVEQDVSPPVIDFTADVVLTCDGVVNFSDLSTNIPFTWAWDFGDGNTSVQQNPTHTYTTDGIYNVELIASNSFGSNVLTMTAYVEVATANNVLSATCDPQTLAYCCEYGIYKVQLNTINNSSVNAIEGYQDFSCQKQTDLTAGNSYLLNVRTGPDNPQDTKVWIDYNNDGAFDNSTELVMEALNAYDPQLNITIPTSGITNNTWLRMRVSSDEVGNTFDACSDMIRGQVEDYAINISQDIPLVSNFSSNSSTVCFGSIVNFTDTSIGFPTSWIWEFGDGATSVVQNPTHIYTVDGSYDVQLIVSNQYGSDTILKTNYIIVSSAASSSFITQSVCYSYTSPSGSTYNSTGIYNDTIPNSFGCDSVITIDLTVNPNQFSPDFTVNTNSFTSPPFLVEFTNTTPNSSNYNFTWNFSDGTILQSNNPSVFHEYMYNGLYDVTLIAEDINTGCSDTIFYADYIYCTGSPNGIDEIISNLNIHPNPTSDQITIDIKGYNGLVTVAVYDLQGRLLETTTNTIVSLRKHAKGIYVLKVSYGEVTELVRVVRD